VITASESQSELGQRENQIRTEGSELGQHPKIDHPRGGTSSLELENDEKQPSDLHNDVYRHRSGDWAPV
jgi:hypothetical protein